MSERLRQIKFRGFRGLPDYTCVLKGRNLLVCGGNGKGKSAIVDGVEFFFSGSVARFRGEGTGNINHDSAIRNINAKTEPSVEIALMPSNTAHSRELGGDITPTPTAESVCSYISDCAEPSAFILRRSQILGFIESQDSDRYQRLVALLGLRSIQSIQEAFVQASQEASRRAVIADTRYKTLLRSYDDKEASFLPASAQGVRQRCARLLSDVGIPAEATPEGLVKAEAELEKKRSPETRKRLDSIALALGSLSVEIGEKFLDLVDMVETCADELTSLTKESAEAEHLPILNAGYGYFSKHGDLETCPLCEQLLLKGYEHVFARLKTRREALGRVSEAQRKHRESQAKLISEIERMSTRLGEDLRQVAELDEQLVKYLNESRDSLVTWSGNLRTKGSLGDATEVLQCLKTLQIIREEEAKRLRKLQSKLTSQQNEGIEAASSFLKRYIQNEAALANAEASYKGAAALARRAEAAEQAFTKARESSLSAVLKRMEKTVLDYYIRLHDIDGSECTKVEFRTTGRARGGGLQFVIEFLGSAPASDPRAYLSEGHLDSLGLCLYLATAKLFNQPETPLILDDVLTSADREHRHRVIELLLEEFTEFQLILTTHDERWFSIFQDNVAVRGDQSDWRFQRIANWSVDFGPESAAYEGTWDYIRSNLNEDSYRELGGSLRLVLEDFMKRVAEKIELEVRYRISADYTAGDFKFAGLVKKLREKLLAAAPQEEAEIKKQLTRAFGDDALINFLSHDNLGRLEVTLQQTNDFVEGLQEVLKFCETYKLIKGTKL